MLRGCEESAKRWARPASRSGLTDGQGLSNLEYPRACAAGVDPVVDSHDRQPTGTTERRAYWCSSVCVKTLKHLGVNLRPIATFPLEHDKKDSAVCHIDHLRCDRIRTVFSAVGAHPKALQRLD